MRQAAEITQADLAASLGVSQARVSKIEHGENSGIDVVAPTSVHSVEHLDVIARASLAQDLYWDCP